MAYYVSSDSMSVEYFVDGVYNDTQFRMVAVKGATKYSTTLVNAVTVEGIRRLTFEVDLTFGDGCYVCTIYRDSIDDLTSPVLIESVSLGEVVIRKISLSSYIDI